ncbi:hypothetical protein [Thermoanaerobacter italicus]|nr:hypothetical protein [Thermoanaerobacter italicus]
MAHINKIENVEEAMGENKNKYDFRNVASMEVIYWLAVKNIIIERKT